MRSQPPANILDCWVCGERAERLGGELVVSSEPNKGTEVAVSVPLSPNKEQTGKWRRLLDRLNFAGPMRS